MKRTTRAISKEEYKEIIQTMREGFCGCQPNERIATALVLEANLGLRISDIMKLKLSDIVLENGRYHLDIDEEKTGKPRKFTVPNEIYTYIQTYAIKNGKGVNDYLFTKGYTEPKNAIRSVQKQLKIVCDYLDYKNVSTHSFRKFFATEIYKNNNYDIALVSELLQHSNTATTRRYIGISSQEVEKALENHIYLM